MHARFRGRIGSRGSGTDRLQGPHGTGLHDRAATARVLHGFRGGLRGEELALKDDAEEAIILGLPDLEKRLRREDTSVVEQHVETTESVDRRFHDGFAGRRQSNIASMHDDTLARRVDLARDCLGLGTIAAVDDDRTVLCHEPGRDLFAYPRSTSGDDGNLVLETHSHLLLRLSIDRSMSDRWLGKSD